MTAKIKKIYFGMSYTALCIRYLWGWCIHLLFLSIPFPSPDHQSLLWMWCLKLSHYFFWRVVSIITVSFGCFYCRCMSPHFPKCSWTKDKAIIGWPTVNPSLAIAPSGPIHQVATCPVQIPRLIQPRRFNSVKIARLPTRTRRAIATQTET